LQVSTFYETIKKNEPKENVHVPLFPDRRCVGRRARKLASAQTVRALFPSEAAMLGLSALL
jgi:hypothetical protein